MHAGIPHASKRMQRRPNPGAYIRVNREDQTNARTHTYPMHTSPSVVYALSIQVTIPESALSFSTVTSSGSMGCCRGWRMQG